ncbi:MAG: ABC transporter permease [Lachnospiraceae bacterium]|nr:ABC transporter permease [Lachnospiraceae bacterium]
MKSKVLNNSKTFFKKLTSNQIIIPLLALLFLIVFNLIRDPGFFEIKVVTNTSGHTVWNGNLMSIIDFGSELAILTIGMTFVTAASGGQDISIGATAAIAGSIIARILTGADGRAPQGMEGSLILAFLVAVLACVLCGAFNGTLVAYFKIPPMVATLILFTAGRSIASWINENRNISIVDDKFMIIGGFIPGIPIPTPFFIAVLCMIITALVLKFTTLGLYTQAVGINENSSRLNGINPKFIKLLTFMILGLGAAVAGLIKVSRTGTCNYAGLCKDIEMDAILAVALGGNALGGGKFNLKASILGAYIIQFLTTTLLAMEVPSTALPAYKAVVVIILVVFSSPVVREKMNKLSAYIKVKTAKNVGKEGEN